MFVGTAARDILGTILYLLHFFICAEVTSINSQKLCIALVGFAGNSPRNIVFLYLVLLFLVAVRVSFTVLQVNVQAERVLEAQCLSRVHSPSQKQVEAD